MGEIFPDGDGTLSLCRLDASWARRAADFDARVFGNPLSSPVSSSSLPPSLRGSEATEAISSDSIAGVATRTAQGTTDCHACLRQARNDGEGVTPRNDVDEAWPFEVWQEMLSNPELSFFAYVRAPEGLQVRGDIVALGGISSGDEPEILTLGVECSWRGQGLGGKLLDLLIAQAKKNVHATHVTLEVRPGNEQALALYTSRGFRPCTSHSRYSVSL